MGERVGSFVIEGKGKKKQIIPNPKDEAMVERKRLSEEAKKSATTEKGVKENAGV